MRDEIKRKLEEAIRRKVEEKIADGSFAGGFHAGGAYTGRAHRSYEGHTPGTRPRVEIEINPRDPVEQRKDEVTIWRDDSMDAYYVKLPRRGRLGDLRLCDAETGQPLNIGPTIHGSEFVTVQDALKHFTKVDEAFKRLFGG